MVKMRKGGLAVIVPRSMVKRYAALGYAVIEETPQPAVEEKQDDGPENEEDCLVSGKPLDKMTVAELKEYAEEKGIDISACENKAAAVKLIKDLLDE